MGKQVLSIRRKLFVVNQNSVFIGGFHDGGINLWSEKNRAGTSSKSGIGFIGNSTLRREYPCPVEQ